MVTVIPPDFDYSDIGRNLGKGAANGYQDRADEMAIQKAVQSLPKGYSPRQLLDTVLGVKTYKNESKQQFFKNALGVQEFEFNKDKNVNTQQAAADKLAEDKRHHLATEDAANNKIESKATSDANKAEKDEQEVKALLKIANPSWSPEKIDKESKGLTPTSVRALITKPENVAEYDIAKNHAKRFDAQIKHYSDKALEAKEISPVTEAAILNNESYTDSEKVWDWLVDSAGSMFSPLKSKKGQELEAYTPISMASFGQKMGGVLTNRKIELISKKAVGLGKDKNANRLFLYLDYANKKLDILRDQFSNEIIEQSKYGLAPKDFDRKLEEKLKPYQKMITGDIDLLLKDKQPKSPIMQLDLKKQMEDQTPPGHVPVMSPQGVPGFLPEAELNLPEYKEYKRIIQ